MLPYQISWKNIKKSYKNNQFKISAPMWNYKFKLPNRSHLVSDIQNYFEYIIKRHEIATENSLIRIYVNKIENTITFKIEAGYYLELLRPKTMKLLGGTNNKTTKDKNGRNVPRL